MKINVLILLLIFFSYQSQAQYNSYFSPVKDPPKILKNGEFSNWEMFDINLNQFGRFPYFSKDGHPYFTPLTDAEFKAARGLPYINKAGEKASVIFLDKDLKVLGKDIYMPYFSGLHRGFTLYPNTWNFDKNIKFKSVFDPGDSKLVTHYHFAYFNKSNIRYYGSQGPFADGIVRVNISYFNLTGEAVLNDKPTIEYKQFIPSNGFILVKNILVEGANRNSLGYNFIDTNGKQLFKENLYYAKEFREGLAEVCIQEDKAVSGHYKKCGYINTNGEYQIPVKFSETESFQYGLAEVEEIISTKTKTDWKGVLNYVPGVETQKTTIEKQRYLINQSGEKILTLTKDFQAFPLEKWFVYHEVMRKKSKPSKSIFSSGEPQTSEITGHEIGILTRSGEKLVSFKKDELEIYQGEPHDNILILKNIKTNQSFILNEKNEISEIPNYNFFNGFHNGMAIVVKDKAVGCGLLYKVENGDDRSRIRTFCPDQEGYINLNGELQIPFTFRHISNFAKERALVILNDGSNALIDKQGKVIKGSEVLNP